MKHKVWYSCQRQIWFLVLQKLKLDMVAQTLPIKTKRYTSDQWGTTQWKTWGHRLWEICWDVRTKPKLLQITKNKFEKKVNTTDNAWLDISARELWNSCDKTFLDIRITYDVCLQSKETVCAARVMCPFGISAVCYNVGTSHECTIAASAFCVNCILLSRFLFIVSLALIIVKNSGLQILLLHNDHRSTNQLEISCSA